MTHAGLLEVDAQFSMGDYYWEEYHIFGDPSLVIIMGPKYSILQPYQFFLPAILAGN